MVRCWLPPPGVQKSGGRGTPATRPSPFGKADTTLSGAPATAAEAVAEGFLFIYFMGGMYGRYWANSQHRKKTIGMCRNICKTA